MDGTRINDLFPEVNPLASDNVVIDGATTRRTSIQHLVAAGLPAQIGTTAGTVAAGDDVRVVLGGTSLQPTTGLPRYLSRAAAIAAVIAAPVLSIAVQHAGLILDYVRDASGTALTTADGGKWSPAGIQFAEHFGAIGDDATDDYAALQAAADTNRMTVLMGKTYRTTQQINVDPIRNRNVAFVSLASIPSKYPYTDQSGGPAWNGREAVIKYDGVSGDDIAVIAASAEAVGVEPTSTFANTVWGLTLRNITLDANGKAGFGLYGARVQSIDLESVKARGANVSGISLNGTYSGSLRRVHCYLNPGRGFEIGGERDRKGWTVNDKCNALYVYDLHCEVNGSSSKFRESDANLIKENCGLYFGPHRSCHVFGLVSENNFGANVVFEPTSTGNTIRGIYTELGCKFAPTGAGSDAISLGYATKQLGLVVIGSAAMLNAMVADGVLASDYIRLTGVSPTPARRESAFEINNISLCPGLEADWGAYRLVNCANEMVITGAQPSGAYTLQGGVQFAPGGSVLDGYETASVALALRGATGAGTGWAYTVAQGSYERIGKQVTFRGRIVLSAVSGDATGQIQIPLPAILPAAAGNNFYAPCVVRASALASTVVNVMGEVSQGGTAIGLYKRTAASAADSTVALADLQAGTTIDFSVTYRAA